jgi:DNA-binding MarR family transcriptional regulator
VDDAQVEELRTALARLVRRLRAEKADDQLGDTHNAVLTRLMKEGPFTLGELAEHSRVTPPSMNQTINSLADAGYVVREPDAVDRRKVLVRATPAGIALAQETSRLRHQWLADQLDELSDADRRALIKATGILRRIADA